MPITKPAWICESCGDETPEFRIIDEDGFTMDVCGDTYCVQYAQSMCPGMYTMQEIEVQKPNPFN